MRWPRILIHLLVLACPLTGLPAAVDAQQRALDAAQVLARTPLPAMHVALGEAVRFDVRLHCDVHAPRAQAQRWQFAVAGPALCDGQRTLSVAMDPQGRRETDLSAWRRSLQMVELAADKARPDRAAVWWSARIELRSRTLTDGPGGDPVPALPVPQRTAALASTPFIDWTSEAFQGGLDAADLRPRSGEHQLAFARRVLLHVRSLRYAFTERMDRDPAAVLAAGASDCGGLGGLAAATLRAAGIPARLLVGRWARSSDAQELLEGLPYHQEHVKLEFHLHGIGWIPADAAVGLRDPTAWFGRQDADFITLHVDPGMRLGTMFGERELQWAQGVAFWIRANGTLDGMTVDEGWTVTPVR
jgi:hypothetical protein